MNQEQKRIAEAKIQMMRLAILIVFAAVTASAHARDCRQVAEAKARLDRCEESYLKEVVKAARAKVADNIRLAAADCIARQIETFVEYSSVCPNDLGKPK